MRKIIQESNLTWVDIKKPEEKDIEWLKQSFNLHPIILRELLPPIDHPRAESFGNYLYIVLFYPFFDQKSSQTIPFELDIIVSKDWIITSHYKDIVPLQKVFDQCNLYEEIRKEYFDEGPAELIHLIISETLRACFPKLDHIKEHLDKIEELIYKNEFEKAIDKISPVKRDIIGFQRIIEPQQVVLENLVKESKAFFEEKFLPYFHNLISLYSQVSSILNTHKKTLDALNSTNESLLTNRTNKIIKTLTIFSVIVFPLTLLASIFGMNLNWLPIVGMKYDFWIIMGIMILATVGMLLVFKAKKWI